MSVMPFEHRMAAHCETGTVAALCNHAGLTITEPMVFGIAGGIFFVYLDTPSMPFPMFAVRTKPGKIPRTLAKRLDIGLELREFRSMDKAMADMDDLVARKIPAAVQVDLFNMAYFPPHARVHFNGHCVTVIGREDGVYTVSDCYYPTPARLEADVLARARFARGMLAPHGRRFYVKCAPKHPDLRGPIIAGIKESVFNMTGIPIPFLGVKGIRTFAKKLPGWPRKARDLDHLSHEVMKIHLILEEQGTGGGGFRFMYATFLQQAAQALGNPRLDELAKEMMAIGDRWREISLFVARIGRKRDLGDERMRELSSMVMQRADEEDAFFRKLGAAVK
jgi:hypothetical protein